MTARTGCMMLPIACVVAGCGGSGCTETATVDGGNVAAAVDIARGQGDRVDHARIVRTVEFDDAPSEPRLACAIPASRIPELRVTIIDAASGLKYRRRNPA